MTVVVGARGSNRSVLGGRDFYWNKKNPVDRRRSKYIYHPILAAYNVNVSYIKSTYIFLEWYWTQLSFALIRFKIRDSDGAISKFLRFFFYPIKFLIFSSIVRIFSGSENNGFHSRKKLLKSYMVVESYSQRNDIPVNFDRRRISIYGKQ